MTKNYIYYIVDIEFLIGAEQLQKGDIYNDKDFQEELDLNEDDKIKLLSQKHDELLQWAKALPKR